MKKKILWERRKKKHKLYSNMSLKTTFKMHYTRILNYISCSFLSLKLYLIVAVVYYKNFRGIKKIFFKNHIQNSFGKWNVLYMGSESCFH